MSYLIAADAGGTKTELVLFDETGHVAARNVSLGCNGMDIGKPLAEARLTRAIETVARQAEAPVESFFGGIAGIMPLGDFLSPAVKALLPGARVHIEDDGTNMISSEIAHEDGCGMVCGTGSSLFIRKGGRIVDKLGGKGYLIDTGGSGFELGRDAICMAMRSAEHRCRHTVLEELVSEAMGKPVRESMADIYDIETGGRPFIASFAHVVFEGRKLGDWACEEIFDRGAFLLADLTHAAEGFFEGDFKVVLNGGLPRAYPEYFEAVRERVSKRAILLQGTVAPVFGAALEALWQLGGEDTPEFRNRFLSEYERLISQ